MPPTYATRAHLYALSALSSVLQDCARLVWSVDASSNRITLGGCGLELDAPLQFVAGDAGALPAPLSANTVYYARPIADSDSLFEVAATPGGAAIDLTTAGTMPFYVVVPIGPTMDQILEKNSRIIDAKMSAHAVPFSAPYPTWVVSIDTDLSAADLLRRLGKDIPLIAESGRIAWSNLETFAKGMPLRDPRATKRTNFVRSAAADDTDRSGEVP